MNTYEKKTLANGMRLITAPLHESQTATIIVMFATGSRYETPAINGMSHFLEHMFFKGTRKRPTSLDITKELDGVGAEFNAFTGKDHTAYYIKVDHKHLSLAIDVVADMLLNSKFDEQELEKEKGVIGEEINMYRDNPLMYIGDIFEEEMYKESSLGWLISGSHDTVKAATRQSMVDYKETHYRGDNTVVAVAGRLSPDIKERVEQAFGALTGSPQTNAFGYAKHEMAQTEPRVRLLFRDVSQAQLGFGFPSYPYGHPDLIASKVMATVLGGNMSSRLFVSVREKHGLAYMVRAGVSEYQDIGNIMIQAGLDKDRLFDAVKLIRQELALMAEKGVSEEELTRAKAYMQGKKSIDLEDTSSLAQWYAQAEALTNTTLTPQERFAQIDAVTQDDVRRVAGDLFDMKKATLAVIGPFKDKQAFLSLLS